ncbi:MAG: type II secretion system protein [Sedimentisphaeraceae bacterium JB056]
MKSESRIKAKGFTIVELLTVMGVIVVLISLLLPALSMVRDFSREIQQKAQFHSIEVGAEMYQSDYGTLPPSYDNDPAMRPTGSTDAADTTPYSGASKLAEAMVGMDLLGFHPNSDYRADGLNDVKVRDATGAMVLETDQEIYTATSTIANANWQTAEENLDARTGPYIDLENANAFRLGQIYQNIGAFAAPSYLTDVTVSDGPLVLCDVFAEKRQSGEKTGTPILYFKARTQYKDQNYQEKYMTTFTGDEWDDDIYNYLDNFNIIDLNVASDQNVSHAVKSNSVAGSPALGIDIFEDMIINDKVTSLSRPYRANSFILWSAGKDGLYGTSDDIFNFDKDKE